MASEKTPQEHPANATPSEAPAAAGSDAPAAASDAAMDKADESTQKTFDALSPSAAESGHTTAMTQKKLDILHKLSVNTVYLMGTSFIVGVLFTVFVLLVLDFMRRNSNTPSAGE